MTGATHFPDRPSMPTGEALAMPRPPGALRRFWRRHPRWVDSIVAGLYFFTAGIFAIPRGYLGVGIDNPLWPLELLLVATSSGFLLARRHRPWLVFAVVSLSTLIASLINGLGDPIAISVALYSIAVYRSIRAAWAALGISVVLRFGIALVMPETQGEDLLWSAVLVSGAFLLPAFIATLVGATVGARRRYVDALVDRATQLARERDQQAQLAAAAERARITREMHDIVAHSLSILVSLADGAAAMIDTDPARAKGAIREMSDTGRRSLSEMRRLLGVLNADEATGADQGAPLRPQPGLEQLPELISTYRAAGVPVVLTTTGDPPAAVGVRSALYRIVQEALTNVLRYADEPRDVDVRMNYEDAGADVTVTDNGRRSPTPRNSVGTGRGLIGMRERAQLYGGTMEAGPGEFGGWRVYVTLPQAKDDE